MYITIKSLTTKINAGFKSSTAVWVIMQAPLFVASLSNPNSLLQLDAIIVWLIARRAL